MVSGLRDGSSEREGGSGPEAGGDLDAVSAAEEQGERGDVSAGGVGMEDEDTVRVHEDVGVVVAAHWHERAQVLACPVCVCAGGGGGGGGERWR